MTDFTGFEQLDDKATFCAIVTEHYTTAWAPLTGALSAVPIISQTSLDFAYETYARTLKELRDKVPSQNPDHYKRAACLLDALLRARVIADVEYDEARVAELESGMAFGVSFMDAQYELRELKAFEFYGENANPGLAFDLAFRCCQLYEKADKPYGPDFFMNAIHCLSEYDGHVGGLYLIFKGYWDPS